MADKEGTWPPNVQIDDAAFQQVTESGEVILGSGGPTRGPEIFPPQGGDEE